MNIQDYLHLYIGAECLYDWPYYNETDILGKVTTKIIEDVRTPRLSGAATNVRPYLRPLSDMTEEEMRESLLIKYPIPYPIGRIDFFTDDPKQYGGGVRYTVYRENGDHLMTGTLSQSMFSPKQFIYLLSKGFDLFGLIDAGLALPRLLNS